MKREITNQTKSAIEFSELRQNLPENVQGPNVMGGDDGSGKSNEVMDAYNLYQERQRQAWAKLLGGS